MSTLTSFCDNDIYYNILENFRDGIGLVDLSSRKYIYMNPVHVELTGFTKEEMNGFSVEDTYERVHPDDIHIFIEQQKMMASENFDYQDIEYRWKVKSGEYRWFNNSYKSIRDVNGKPKSIINSIRDITYKKQMEIVSNGEIVATVPNIIRIPNSIKIEDDLKASEHLYRTLFENTEEAFLLLEPIHDHNGILIDLRFVKVNEAYEILTGLRAADVVGKTGKQFTPAIESFWFDVYEKVLKVGKPVHFENYSKRTERWFDGIHFPYGQNYIGALFRDITSKKQLENELYEANMKLALRAEDKYYNLFYSINMGLCIIDVIFDSEEKPVNWRYIDTNPAYQEQTGMNNVSGKLISDLDPNNDKLLLDFYGKVALTGQPMSIINESERSNRWYNIYAFKTDMESKGNITVLFKDITNDVKERKKLEDNLKMQEEILANVSHELKTPLNVIFATTQLLDLKMKKGSVKEVRGIVIKGIKTIRQNCYRFTKLINNIVDITKIDQGFYKLYLRNEDIVALTEGIVQSVIHYVKDNGLHIIFDTDVEEKIIAFDPLKIERIILNLLSNAIKFSNKGSEIIVNVSDQGEFIEISIKDFGIGIEDTSAIFGRYYQEDKSLSRNAEGSGIGLSLVKSLVEMHGGRISVESEVGQGSLFKVLLPARITDQPYQINPIILRDKVEKISVEFSDIYDL